MKLFSEIIKSIKGKSSLRLVIFITLTVVLALFPHLFNSPYALHIMILIFLSVIMGGSWNILGGYTGQYSVGHAA